jgi:glutathione synthase/RimK-type ligase-like ATP-grasp enzyme
VAQLSTSAVRTLFVVDGEGEWLKTLPEVPVAPAREYLTSPAFANGQVERVVNLCRCERTHGPGFFVSLLAEARGHQPMPPARTIEDLRRPVPSQSVRRIDEPVADDGAQRLTVHSYFGIDPEGRNDAVSRGLFSLLKAPLLRAEYRRKAKRWQLSRVRPLGIADVPVEHRGRLADAAKRFIAGEPRPPRPARERAAIAILHTESEALPPSNAAALQKMLEAAQTLGMHAQIIDRHAIERLAEFDALFIRDTTWLGHYTYEFAQRAAALGLVVIDDPDSILQCNNKVYLHELFARHAIPTPRTMMVHSANLDEVVPALGLPCVLKEPGGGFSLGVRRANTGEQFREHAVAMLEKSELIIAQEFLPTTFDWRVTVLDRRPLFVCKYFMASGHWQVHKYEPDGHSEGATQAFSVGEAPAIVVNTALRAANLIGNGLYGVDLKQRGDECFVMEINDNPNIDAGNEDQVLRDALYRELMGVFARRIAERRQAAVTTGP